jgi:deoxyribose-phosphate aldolase
MSLQDKIAQTIDHALLHPTLGERKLEEGIQAVAHLPLASICVKPCHVVRALEQLSDGGISVGTVVGFPHGSHTTASKAAEAAELRVLGAKELDMVINIGAVLEGQWKQVEEELVAVRRAVDDPETLLKCIFETDYVQERASIEQLTKMVYEAGWDYAKTSTGFGFVKNENGFYQYRGAQVQHLQWMRAAAPEMKLKASGGIRTLADWTRMTQAGATRIGTSSTLAILAEAAEA